MLPAVPAPTFDQVPERRVLRVDEVTVDAGTQVREAIDEAVVDDYAERLGEGVRFPPVVVIGDGWRYCLADGFHRFEACRRAGRDQIEADLYVGTRADALWFALGANRTHGQRLHGTDKRHAVELALATWPELSQRRIAAQVGCSQPYLHKVRAEVTTSCHLPARAVGEDGKSYPARRRTSAGPAARESGPDGSRPEPASKPGAGRVPEPGVVPLPLAKHVGFPASRYRVRSSTALHRPEPDRFRPSGSRPSQRARDRSNRIVSVVASVAQTLLAQEDLIDFGALDRSMLSGWIADLERARRDLGRLIRRLREAAGNGAVEAARQGDDPSARA